MRGSGHVIPVWVWQIGLTLLDADVPQHVEAFRQEVLPVGERFDLDGLFLLRFFFLLQRLGVQEWLIALLHPYLLDMERLHLDD